MGKVIVFDGPDGVGKTTQLELTAEWLRSEGHDVHITRASGGTPIGEAIRNVSLADIERPPEVDVYLSLAMHTALGKDLRERKANGQICIVDRSPIAIVAYNVFGAQLENQQLGFDAFEQMFQLWDIDQVVFLNASQQVIDERRAKRNDNQKPSDYFEKKNAAYHERVRQGYDQAIHMLHEHPDWYQHLDEVDGAPDEQHVQLAIQQVVNKVL